MPKGHKTSEETKQQVVEMAANGMNAKDIHATLAKQGAEISLKTVQRIAKGGDATNQSFVSKTSVEEVG